MMGTVICQEKDGMFDGGGGGGGAAQVGRWSDSVEGGFGLEAAA